MISKLTKLSLAINSIDVVCVHDKKRANTLNQIHTLVFVHLPHLRLDGDNTRTIRLEFPLRSYFYCSSTSPSWPGVGLEGLGGATKECFLSEVENSAGGPVQGICVLNSVVYRAGMKMQDIPVCPDTRVSL